VRPKTLLLLAVITLLLGGYIALYERKLPSTEERAAREKKVLALEADEVQALTVRRDDREVRFEREAPAAGEDGDETASPEPRGWRITAPLAARADRLAVDGLLDELLNLEKERTIEDLDREAAGFETRATVELTTAGGETVLEIGPEVPASTSMLVAIEGRPAVYQVSDRLWSTLEREPGEWRDKKVFTARRSDIERLRLSRGEEPGGGLLLARRGEDFWLESPRVDRADPERVNQLLAALTGLTVERFIDPPLDLQAWGLKPPAGTIEVVLAGEETPLVVAVGKPLAEEGEAFYARLGEQTFTTRSQLRELLTRPAASWRSRSWTASQVFAIDRATFRDAAGSLTLSREDGKWLRDGVEIDYASASDLLYAVADAKAVEVLDPPLPDGAGEPQLTIVLEQVGSDGGEANGDGGEENEADAAARSETLTLYAAGDGRHLATASDRPAVLVLSEPDVDKLRDKLAAVRDAEPVAAAEDEPAAGEPESEESS